MQDLQPHSLGRYSQPSLAGMLAQQHQDDIARAAEQHRAVATALASSLDSGKASRVARARNFDALLIRLAAVRTAIARVLDGRHRPGTSHTSPTVACCA